MGSGGEADRSGKGTRRKSLAVRLAALAVFLVVLIGVSVVTIRYFLSEPNKVIVLSPQDLKPVNTTAPPPPANTVVRANRFAFHGTVVDAQTHQPIPKFAVRMGYSYYQGGFSQQRPPYFMGAPALHFSDGHYSMITPFDAGSAKWSVRIEAPGYLPAVSAAQSASGELSFALQPGQDVQGVLVDSTGAAVAGATVMLSVPGLSYDIDTSDLKSLARYAIKATTGKNGEFDLWPETGHMSVAAFNESGFVEVDTTAGASPIQLRLAPWGRATGHVIIAGKPAADRQIFVETTELTPDASQSHMDGYAETKTDADGNYHIDRVIPGNLRVSRMVRQDYPNGGYASHPTQTEYGAVAAGQTATVNLGGHGRAVMGKLILPPGVGPSLKSYYLNPEVSGQSTPPPADLPPQMPDKIKNGSQAARDFWMGVFSLTSAGKQFLALHPPPQPVLRQYTMEFDAAMGGGFRIEDVVPGDYRLWLFPNPMSGGLSLNPVNIEFTVPPVPGGGYSDQPVVIPDITLSKQGT